MRCELIHYPNDRLIKVAKDVEIDGARLAPRIAEAVRDVSCWRFGTDGLTIALTWQQLGLIVGFNPSTLIAWPDLSDVLVDHPPVP